MKSNLSLALLFGLASSVACSSDAPPKCTNTFIDGADSSTSESSCRVDDGGGSLDAGGHSDGGRDASTQLGDAASEDGGHDASVAPPDCSAPPVVTGLKLETIVTGLNRTVYAAQPKGTGDWYIVEQTGIVRVWRPGVAGTSVFLDLTSETVGLGGIGDERGLLSIAFPPDYATSGLFYVTITPTTPDGAERTSLFQHDFVLRYQRSTGNPYAADTTTQTVVLDVPSSANNHNGGTVIVGADGMLYVGTGDGGGTCNDNKPGAPQDISALYGKLLKLDPQLAAPNNGAAGNPFALSGDARVLHYGLRNPFRFSIDRANGDLYIGDVGQGSYEEIDVAPAGAKGFNFGWAAFEGIQSTCGGKQLRADTTHTVPTVIVDRRSTSTEPFADYKAVVGGVVYRGSAIPQLSGAYLFGDYYGNRLGAFYRCGSERSAIVVLRKRCDGSDEACLGGDAMLNAMAAIVQGDDGEIYMVANDTGGKSKLVKLVRDVSAP